MRDKVALPLSEPGCSRHIEAHFLARQDGSGQEVREGTPEEVLRLEGPYLGTGRNARGVLDKLAVEQRDAARLMSALTS
jgi:hypothetical protein